MFIFSTFVSLWQYGDNPREGRAVGLGGGGIPANGRKLTKSDLRFCKNEGSTSSNNNDRVGGGQQLRSKVKEKIGTTCFKIDKWQILMKLKPNFGHIISGSNYYRDKPIVCAERGGH